MDKNVFKIMKERIVHLVKDNSADIYRGSIDLEAEYAVSAEAIPFADRLKLKYRPIHAGDVWGKAWDSAWFHLTGKVPENFAGKELCLLVNVGGEVLLFDEKGIPEYGLTGWSVFDSHFFKDRYVLKNAKAGDRIEIWFEAAANSLLGINLPPVREKQPAEPRGSYSPEVKYLKLCVFDRETWLFLLEMESLCGLLDCYDPDDYRARQLLHALNQAADAYGFDPANSAAAREILRRKILMLNAESGSLTAHAIGHAHLDIAWLWPVRESTRKAARTFSSQLKLMEEYPDYKFGASQPFLYREVKNHYPELYEKIRQRVREGRWELQGGMYVEPDCNLISGESMVRQFLYGKNFFMDEFGVDVKTVWIPDVFGYSAAMPQIMLKSGCKYFLTQKLWWSQINQIPHNTFLWTGVDGSCVLAHFPPENTPIAQPTASERIQGCSRFQEGGYLPGFISLVGIGDGGGGPSENHVERNRILSDLRGCPKSQWRFASDYFKGLEQYRTELPEWKGELYLEFHRGTLTTQGRTKRGNRKCEQALCSLEILASALPASEWPRAKLKKAWETLLLNQFHDIIPGSSIHEVYELAEKQYAQILGMVETETRRCSELLFQRSDRYMTIINTLSGTWSGLLEMPESWQNCTVLDEDGKELPVQLHQGQLQMYAVVPGNSCITVHQGEGKVAEAKDTGSRVLENELVRYEFNSDGQLVSAFDKELQREFLSGNGNLLTLYHDRPNDYEAWEMEIYYQRDKKGFMPCVHAGTVFTGKAGSSVEFIFRTEHSELRQTVRLAIHSKRLDFITRVDWHEYRTLLRTAFPVKVNSERAVYDIQYAWLERATHENTSWDVAKFEVCGHRYAGLSDRDGGAALLNDSKYGYRIKNSTLDLALLRSPVYPDRDADRGEHFFIYSFLPFAGLLPESNVMREAANLNRIPSIADGFAAGDFRFPCRLESDGISLEVIKRAEKDGSLILRLVETRGRHSTGILHFSQSPEEITETDLLEWHDSEPLLLQGNALEVKLDPFEIMTLRAKQLNLAIPKKRIEK